MNRPLSLDPPRLTAGLLALASAAAWLAVFASAGAMVVNVAAFVAAWTIMMTAMMLPSAAPLVLLYRRGASASATFVLAAGYLLVWGALGVPVYFLEMYVMVATSDLAPCVLAAAGLYQLTPLKQSCLKRCRSPADFLMLRWGRSALRLGMEHGLWCAGCCWALMAVLVLAGSMGIAWVVGIAILVAMEKLTKHGVWFAHVTGVVLLLAAILASVRWPGT